MCVGADNLRPLPGTPPTRSAQSACVTANGEEVMPKKALHSLTREAIGVYGGLWLDEA